MDHIAILDSKLKFLEKIISGKKKIESRWYLNKIAPFNKIDIGDHVYFKNSGQKITVVAEVDKVLQFEDLTDAKINEIIKKYGKDIGIEETKKADFQNLVRIKRYCILIYLKNVKIIEKPFNINKKGFGNACAWFYVKNINNIKL